MDIIYHYPPELMKLLIDTIPLLNPSKNDVFLFFKGAGLSDRLITVPYKKWQADKDSISKYEIVRNILELLNRKGEGCLRERREILKRVVEYDNFSGCWPADRLKAKGLVSEVQKLINVKDSFTRMKQERERERLKHIEKEKAEQEHFRKRQSNIESAKKELYNLFSITVPHKRGRLLEKVLNNLFNTFEISIKESFTLKGEEEEGVVEQIDGAIEFGGHIYFIEVKWWNKPLGVSEISQHLVRIFNRAEARAIIISASDFTVPAVKTCKDALQQKVVILCTLQEIVTLLEKKRELEEFLLEKVQRAIIDKNPFIQII